MLKITAVYTAETTEDAAYLITKLKDQDYPANGHPMVSLIVNNLTKAQQLHIRAETVINKAQNNPNAQRPKSSPEPTRVQIDIQAPRRRVATLDYRGHTTRAQDEAQATRCSGACGDNSTHLAIMHI